MIAFGLLMLFLVVDLILWTRSFDPRRKRPWYVAALPGSGFYYYWKRRSNNQR